MSVSLIKYKSGDLELDLDQINYSPASRKQFEAYQPSADSGVMIALKLPLAVAEQIAVPGGNPPEELHCTLTYLGKRSEVGSKWDIIKQVVAGMAERTASLTGSINGVGRFAASESSEDKEVVYAVLDVPGLSELRIDLVDLLELAGVVITKEHGFTPHVTLSYVEPGESLDVPVMNIPASFDRVYLWAGEEHEEFLLG